MKALRAHMFSSVQQVLNYTQQLDAHTAVWWLKIVIYVPVLVLVPYLLLGIGYSVGATLHKLSLEVEQESGSVTDTRLALDLFIVTWVSLFVTNMLPAENFMGNINSVTTLLLLLVLMLMVPPITILTSTGVFAFNYIRGSQTKNSILLNVALDTTVLISFIARFLLQSLRFVVVMVKLAVVSGLLSHLISSTISLSNINNLSLFSIMEVLQLLAHYVFELVETTCVYFSQAGAMLIVVFWLLSALYAHTGTTTQVSWFKDLRANKLA